MSPRPILKNCSPLPDDSSHSCDEGDPLDPDISYTGELPFASSHIPVLDSPHVHFPPTPSLIQFGMTHSSRSYDRKPIDVLPNSLALPERGERDVDTGYFFPTGYTLSDSGDDILSYPSTAPGSPMPLPSSEAHSRQFEYACPQPYYGAGPVSIHGAATETCLDAPLSGPDISTPIALSMHISLSPSPTLTRKRNSNERRPLHRQKKKLRREFANGIIRRVDTLADVMSERPDLSTLGSDVGPGVGLGLDCVAKEMDYYVAGQCRSSDSSFDECLDGF